jgi:hypothetical protein
VIRQICQLFDPDELTLGGAQLPVHVRSGRVVGYAIDPGAERASVVKAFETPPKRDMNLLQQVAARFRVSLVDASQAFERSAIRRHSLLEEIFFAVRDAWY